MKKIYTLLFALVALATTGIAQNFNVTMQVDMSNQMVGPNGVSVAGNFQVAAGFPADWTPGAVVLTDANSDDIYDITVSLPAGTYEFKYLNGNAWGSEEGVPGACAVNSNREMVISSDSTLEAICFGMCTACPTNVDTVMVTLMVDMNNETPADSVTLAGDIQGAAVGMGWSAWTPGQTVMDDSDNDGVYEISFMVPEGTYQYKYVNGTAWGSEESIPSACAVSNNREIVVAGPGPIVVPVHCFASCDTCMPVLPPVNVTFQVDMSAVIISSNGLTVAGNFQNPAWDKDALQLMDPDGDFIYTHTESIVPGEYQFKFFNGGSMDPNDGEFDAGNPGSCAVDNGLGGFNRLLDIVGLTNDTILPIYEYNTCNTVAASLEDGINHNVLVFPNPMSETAIVQLENYDNMPYEVNVINVVGQTVYNQKEILNDRIEISREGLNAGVYFLEIRKDGKRTTRKVIVE